MANRIKGITVEINDDTTKLSKALSGANKDIQNTQSQLKDVEKLLKLDLTNTETALAETEAACRCGLGYQRKAGNDESRCRTGK